MKATSIPSTPVRFIAYRPGAQCSMKAKSASHLMIFEYFDPTVRGFVAVPAKIWDNEITVSIAACDPAGRTAEADEKLAQASQQYGQERVAAFMAAWDGQLATIKATIAATK